MVTTNKLEAPPSRPSVAICGAGRAGTALALALNNCSEFQVSILITHRPRRRSSFLPRLSQSTKILPLERLDEIAVLPAPDILFITTPDDRIEESARLLASVWTKSKLRSSIRVALHLSGALSSRSLEPLGAQGFSVGSMHPLVSLSNASEGAQKLRKAHYCLEGEARAVRIAKLVVKALEGKSFTIESRYKPLYHAAAVMSSGHLVALIDAATEMLTACGLKETSARQLLGSLAASALTNLVSQSAAQALTGPFIRGDRGVVNQHLRALESLGDKNTLEIYLALAHRQLQLAVKRGLDRKSIQAIAKQLNDSEAQLNTL